jgi:hypothetical protein
MEKLTLHLQKIYSFCERWRCDYVDLIDSRDSSRCVGETLWNSFYSLGQYLLQEGRDKERFENFLGEMWNTVASVANNVSVFNATWICLLDCNAAPHYFWSLLVQLRQDKKLNLLVESHRLCHEKPKMKQLPASLETNGNLKHLLLLWRCGPYSGHCLSTFSTCRGHKKTFGRLNCEFLHVLCRRNTIIKKKVYFI